MASAAEKGLAKKALSLRGSSPSITNEVAGAARRVLDGKERAGDMDTIRRALGVRRSGAGALRGMTGQASNIARSAMNVSRDVELAMTSGSSAGKARAAVAIGMEASYQLVRNRRALIKVGEGVAKRIGVDTALASKFFNSLSRVAKLGGVIGAAAVGTFQAGMGYFGALERGGKAGLQMTSAWFGMESRERATEIQDMAERQIKREAVLTPTTGIGVIDAYFASRQQEQTAARQRELMQQTLERRRLLAPGAQAEILAKAAAEKGVAVQDLAQEEINAALDAEAGKHLGYSSSEYFAFTNSRMQDLTWWERQLLDLSPEFFATKHNEWGRALSQQKTDRHKTRMEGKARAEQETWRRLSATERNEIVYARETALAHFSAHRRRHQLHIPD